MGIVLNIDGREAIPVRAIPFITGWNMSPDMVAKGFAQRDGAKRLTGIFAYHTPTTPLKMLPKEWDSVDLALTALSDRIKAEQLTEQEGYCRWRKKSPVMLPVGVFVWLDEFESAYLKAFQPKNWICDDRHGERDINLSPFLPTDLESIVMAGFDSTNTGPNKQRPPVSTDNQTEATEEKAMTWQDRARAIADELDKTDKACGAHDSLKSISERVAERMRALGEKGRGLRGPLSAATILREALQGGKWKRKQ